MSAANFFGYIQQFAHEPTPAGDLARDLRRDRWVDGRRLRTPEAVYRYLVEMEAGEDALMVARELAEEYLGCDWDYPMPWQDDWVERRDAARPQPRRVVPGFIYVMGSPFIFGLIKIGRTKQDVDQRRRTFATGTPGIEVLASWESDDAAADEAALHRIFAANRVQRSEWFSVSLRDVEQAWISLRSGAGYSY